MKKTGKLKPKRLLSFSEQDHLERKGSKAERAFVSRTAALKEGEWTILEPAWVSFTRVTKELDANPNT